MSVCYGKYASVYDILYADKPYHLEAQFIDDCLCRYGDGPVTTILELASGTGSHALELEKKGYTIIATDNSEEMITYAKQKASSVKSGIDFRVQDMRSIKIPEHAFDAIICLFDSIGYITSNDDLNKTFRGIFNHLKKNGLFVFEFWHAAAMLRHYDPVRTKYLKTDLGNILRISETELDYASQTASVHYTIYELMNKGTFTRYDETHRSRFFLTQEMAIFLSSNGLIPIKFFDGFSFNERITDNTWHIICVAQKNSSHRMGCDQE